MIPGSPAWRDALMVICLAAIPAAGCGDPCATLETTLCDEAPNGKECALIREPERRAQLSRSRCDRILDARGRP